MSRLSDKTVIFLFSMLGYLITASIMVIAMRPVEASLKLAGIIFIPYMLASYLVCTFWSLKIIEATTSGKAIRHSICAALMVGVLTSFIFGIAASTTEFFKHAEVSNWASALALPLVYVLFGFFYALPGALIGGIALGKVIYNRRQA